jgi:hypothetical protein
MNKRVLVTSACLAGACGGEGGTGPTTTHRIGGTWTYEGRSLRDGRGTTCTITGSLMTLSQAALAFSGSITGGSISCSNTGGTFTGGLGTGPVTDGRIRGDSATFVIDGDVLYSFGTFVTPDSIAGVANAIFVVEGVQYILVGLWSSRRQS